MRGTGCDGGSGWGAPRGGAPSIFRSSPWFYSSRLPRENRSASKHQNPQIPTMSRIVQIATYVCLAAVD